MSESMSDMILGTIERIKEASRAANNYNDFGSFLGVQDEINAIDEDLDRELRIARSRAARLIRRIKQWEAGERKVDMLHLENKKESQ
jgi:hypothetical protein